MPVPENYEPDEVITLETEDGEAQDFILADAFNFNERMYAVLVPISGDDESSVMLRLEEGASPDEMVLVDIEDESEWEAAITEYERQIDDIALN